MYLANKPSLVFKEIGNRISPPFNRSRLNPFVFLEDLNFLVQLTLKIATFSIAIKTRLQIIQQYYYKTGSISESDNFSVWNSMT